MVAFAHGTSSTNNGPDCESAAEGNEGFFAEPAPDLLEGVLIVKVPDCNEAQAIGIFGGK